MKKFLIIACMLAGFTGFAQEGIEVKGNKITIKESAPVWPGCEGNEDLDACFNKMLMQHVRKTYKYPKNEKGEFIRGKATVSMIVNEKGKVVVKSVEGKYPAINKEAKRMVEAMPTMIPGTKAGKPTSISYKIPLNF
ncbi:energy transducer TonB [Christiangramia salexigens]|uniref:Energy transducer TonB n=1 Tax=Christiangramia salexigens TaxID=1913577 RepID=A0A1L3J5D2_9FLAO|nr:energy transducer TonB [Christiangramia salexigens]APG60312.1 energy transducer TonB [Christiangramia salexigens]